jgi:hypothetical protein
MPKLRLRAAGVIPAMTLGTFAAAAAVRFFVFHNYDLTLDEFMPRFQAQIFLHGLLLAPLSDLGLRLHGELQPFFTYVDAHHALWGSHYRPVHAALLALAGLFGMADLLNPLMAAISVLAMAAIARRLWPEQAAAAIVAPLLLILSPQFLMTSGTGFAFPSHLAFNLVWLVLLLNGNLRSHIAATAIGMLAIGLHQVQFHVLFAAPFLLALLAGKFGPRSHAVPYVIGYTVALPIWVLWPELAVYIQTGDTSVLPHSILGIDYIHDYFVNRATHVPTEAGIDRTVGWVTLCRFWLWLSPAALPLIPLAILYWRKLGLVLRLAAMSFVLNLVVNQILMPNQMQSWGARYSHPVLGNLILFATGGLFAFTREHGWRPIRSGLAMLCLASVGFLGLRGIQIEAKVAPRAAVQRAISRLDAKLVIIDAPKMWFAPDLVRNDPFLRNRPLIAYRDRVGALRDLASVGGRHVVLSRARLTAMGLPERTLYEPGPAVAGR